MLMIQCSTIALPAVMGGPKLLVIIKWSIMSDTGLSPYQCIKLLMLMLIAVYLVMAK